MSELHPDVIAAINKVAGTPLGRKYDREMRAKYGKSGVAVAGKTVIGEFGNRSTKSGRGVVSSAGARGPAQFIKSTRDAYIQKYGIDPWKDDTSAIQGMMRHHLETGIAGYNPGMPTYEDYILGQKLGSSNKALIRRGSKGGGKGTSDVTIQGPGKTDVSLQKQVIPGQSFEAERAAARASLLTSPGGLNMGKLLAYKRQTNQLQDIPERTISGDLKVTRTPGKKVKVQGSAADVPLGGGAPGSGQFKITGPEPGRLRPELVSFARKVARVYGKPLTGSDGTGHSRLTTSGRVSEHTTGNATDIPLAGKELLRAGRAALIAAGMPRAQALKAQGGIHNVGNHQIIFATNEGGNHFDHLHISSHGRR